MKYDLAIKKEQTIDTYNKEESQKHCTKWTKADMKACTEEQEKHYRQWLGRTVGGDRTKNHEITFWGDGNILYLDSNNIYKTVCVCRNS